MLKRKVGARRAGVGAALAAIMLAACASAPSPAPENSSTVTSSGTWTYAFDAGPGLASATLSAGDGLPIVRVTCKAPNGRLNIQDWTFSRTRQNGYAATFSVGGRSGSFVAIVAGDGAGRQALAFEVGPRDPVFADLTPNAPVTTSVAGITHTWAPGAASRLNDVINSCHTIGS